MCRSGEPVCGFQMRRYFSADSLDRLGKMRKFSMIHHSHRGVSTTRGSPRNSRKYRLTADGVGSSGVPSCMSRTPILANGADSRTSSWECRVLRVSSPLPCRVLSRLLSFPRTGSRLLCRCKTSNVQEMRGLRTPRRTFRRLSCPDHSGWDSRV